jgi:hypothetical protein
MWLMTTKGAYSIIEWHDGRMCVRARMPGDIARLRKLMPSLGPETVTPTRDYRYRAFTDREGLAEGLANVARDVDYGNFKSAVEKTKLPKRYAEGLHSIWSIMARWQPGGAYGAGNGAPVPASEKKIEAAGRAADVAEKLALRAQFSGKPCEDCGKVRKDGEMDVYGGRWLCKSITLCRPSLAKH